MQDSYLLYMCLILPIIQSTMGYWGELSAFLPSQSSHTILSVPPRCNFFMAKMHQKRPYLHSHNLLITNIIIIIYQYLLSPLNASSQFLIFRLRRNTSQRTPSTSVSRSSFSLVCCHLRSGTLLGVSCQYRFPLCVLLHHEKRSPRTWRSRLLSGSRLR